MCTSWSGSEVCCSAAARRAGTILGRNRCRVSPATEDSTARALVLMGGVTSWGGDTTRWVQQELTCYTSHTPPTPPTTHHTHHTSHLWHEVRKESFALDLHCLPQCI